VELELRPPEGPTGNGQCATPVVENSKPAQLSRSPRELHRQEIRTPAEILHVWRVARKVVARNGWKAETFQESKRFVHANDQSGLYVFSREMQDRFQGVAVEQARISILPMQENEDK
jgi:hypothetical protein